MPGRRLSALSGIEGYAVPLFVGMPANALLLQIEDVILTPALTAVIQYKRGPASV